MAKTEKSNALTSSVKIVDGKLILSLPTAQTPVVWQMDIEKAQSAAFTVQENKKAKNFALILKTQDGTLDEIAPFDDKESAVEILMQTSAALQNGHGQINRPLIKSSPDKNATTQDSNKKSDKLGAMLAAALVFVLVLIWIMSAAGPGRIGESGGVQNQSASLTAENLGNARESAGVPVSADDFLNNR